MRTYMIPAFAIVTAASQDEAESKFTRMAQAARHATTGYLYADESIQTQEVNPDADYSSIRDACMEDLRLMVANHPDTQHQR